MHNMSQHLKQKAKMYGLIYRHVCLHNQLIVITAFIKTIITDKIIFSFKQHTTTTHNRNDGTNGERLWWV